MKKIIGFLFLLSTLMFSSFSSSYACDFKNDVPVTSLSAGFDAWKVVMSAAEECGNVTSTLDQDFSKKQVAAMTSNPSQFTIGGVANSTNTALLDAGATRPLDDLVAKYGSSLQENQLIRVDGKIMAIAMMVNSQHLFYREDILNDLGINIPTTYAEVIAAAKKIQAAGVVDYPFGGTYKTGWNLGENFVEIYLGMGGSLFDGNNASINNSDGIAALNLMKELSSYMDPEFLTSDSTYVQKQFQQGKIAMANLWASRAGAMNNAEESKVVGLVKFAAAPIAKDGQAPAATLWWDGFTIAKNVSDEEAEAGFRVMMAGINPVNLEANKDAAIWLSTAFEPSKIAVGAVATASGGAPGYPASSKLGILHTNFGNTVGDFLSGAASAEATLEKIEADYTTSAKEKGLL
tara:strand:- start:4157 stop:5371 length:1215 start_codon:yes stop_codon:yes gene_type:complete